MGILRALGFILAIPIVFAVVIAGTLVLTIVVHEFNDWAGIRTSAPEHPGHPHPEHGEERPHPRGGR